MEILFPLAYWIRTGFGRLKEIEYERSENFRDAAAGFAAAVHSGRYRSRSHSLGGELSLSRFGDSAEQDFAARIGGQVDHVECQRPEPPCRRDEARDAGHDPALQTRAHGNETWLRPFGVRRLYGAD